jgi:hypothetical protein
MVWTLGMLTAAFLGGRQSGRRGDTLVDVRDVDLPCPWCHAPTAEDDPACPSCGRRFGSPADELRSGPGQT